MVSGANLRKNIEFSCFLIIKMLFITDHIRIKWFMMCVGGKDDGHIIIHHP
mgnify:CR=1 FL=1